MDNRELIDAFTTHLGRQKGYPNLEVDRWPDEENRQSPEIDALAGPFAIEHTSIDALPDQRRADDWYSRIVAGLDREIASFVDCESTGFTIALEFNAIRAISPFSTSKIVEVCAVWYLMSFVAFLSSNSLTRLASELSRGSIREKPLQPDRSFRTIITIGESAGVGVGRIMLCDP